MKLLKSQYQDILDAMDELGIVHYKLSLVKKRGRIKIRIDGVESYFEFFRKKSVAITAEHQWEKSEYYEINSDGKVSVTTDWPNVTLMIKSWLTTCKGSSN